MEQHETIHPDYGTGEKKLGIYLIGLLLCSILTLLAFWIVMSGQYTKWQMFIVIYPAACTQFLVQVICFLRLNTATDQGRNNIMAFIFTGVILTSIIVGSLWIMWNLNYNMMQ